MPITWMFIAVRKTIWVTFTELLPGVIHLACFTCINLFISQKKRVNPPSQVGSSLVWSIAVTSLCLPSTSASLRGVGGSLSLTIGHGWIHILWVL